MRARKTWIEGAKLVVIVGFGACIFRQKNVRNRVQAAEQADLGTHPAPMIRIMGAGRAFPSTAWEFEIYKPGSRPYIGAAKLAVP